MGKTYFVTATGTDIGKSFICCKMIEALRQKDYEVKAIKPILTGVNKRNLESLNNSDSYHILRALGKKPTLNLLEKISPFNFSLPKSPDIAAFYGNEPHISYADLFKYCAEFASLNDANYGFIEGAGGVMVPLNLKKNTLDLIKDLDVEVILVTGSYLGTLSHSLTALKALEGFKIKQIIMNDIANDAEELKRNHESLQRFSNQKIFKLPHQSSPLHRGVMDDIVSDLSRA